MHDLLDLENGSDVSASLEPDPRVVELDEGGVDAAVFGQLASQRLRIPNLDRLEHGLPPLRAGGGEVQTLRSVV